MKGLAKIIEGASLSRRRTPPRVIEINGEQLYSMEKALEVLGISRRTAYNWQYKGHLTPVKDTIAKTVYYRKAQVEGLLSESRFENF